MSKIRTRLAPSPTGKFHIGTARTALFNYLFAKKNKGEFLLRFEDTDQERSTIEFEDDIREGLKWLGLKWDEEARQMDRLDSYKKYSDKLISEGSAYEKEGAVWLKVPEEKIIEFDDLIRGKISFNSKEFNDFVIVKSDGVPTFYFSNAIDDFEMEISHVIRGEDHITNTPKQIMILESLGIKQPEFGHIPLIFNEDRSKLSKRKNAVSLTEYQEKGYLPEAIINFLALLGWNPGDEREFFTLDELIKEFSLERVQKSPAVFDVNKLDSINNHYLRQKSDKELAELAGTDEKFASIFKERARTLNELKDLAKEIQNYNEKYDSNSLIFKKNTKEESLKGLLTVNHLLLTLDDKSWDDQEKLNNTLASVVEKEELTNGSVFWPVRVALSGLEKSPSPAELLWVLGKEESIKRINIAINKIS